jgi:hypothetical protein
MANKNIKVRGIVSCAGLWGALGEGEERELDLEIAESLMRAGYAEPVDDASTDAQHEKKESPASDEPPPRRKSRRAKES